MAKLSQSTKEIKNRKAKNCLSMKQMKKLKETNLKKRNKSRLD